MSAVRAVLSSFTFFALSITVVNIERHAVVSASTLSAKPLCEFSKTSWNRTVSEQGGSFLTGKAAFVEATRVILEMSGENPGDEYGWVARRIGDVDGDKVSDFVVTAPGFNSSSGKVYIVSTRTGNVLFTRSGSQGQRYGNGANGAGDVNHDGVPDIIVGAPFGGYGLAEVVSGKDGTVLHSLKGPDARAQFGNSVAGIGDCNGDGYADFAVTAPRLRQGDMERAHCYIYSGKDGHMLHTLTAESPSDKFGTAVAGLTHKGRTIVVVGAQDAGPDKRGKIYAYQITGTTVKPLFTFDGRSSSNNLGQMFLSFPGDLDGDGVPDIFCSDFMDSGKAPNTGRVYVLSGKTGKVIHEIAGSTSGEGFGTSVSDAGDADGDGIGDLIVGAWQNSAGAKSGGRVALISGKSGKVLRTWTCRQENDTLGFDATGLGDVDGDGGIDFLVTSAWSETKGKKTGRVFVLAGPKPMGSSKKR